MEHLRKYNSKKIEIPNGTILVEGPVPTNELQRLKFHEGLTAFRIPEQQFAAIIEISKLPEGRMIIARLNDTIIAYATFLYPDPLERWSEGNMENLLELGAIEVAPEFRGTGVGKSILQVAMMDDAMEDYIVITTEYYWHWDLKRTGLNVWQYRKVMEKMMQAGGLEVAATDDPEISSHPANCLMVRIGKRVDQKSIKKFDQLRIMNRYMN
ncbi:GNAT family N-acetyltransferase [Rummeliibacillus sp. TYF005]|uniref:GNAT family N-acetyltransferase n=1 Tax=Rummeliibacillus sp. TYF005 TaxID=2058214 RepID=UPI000F530335|nr:GNAT family N-acetyltransferase [Rummeliibacillus sp. TYF005]RPJ95849.1 GNAT family N-acetyltransferase [Rummeliibacillus sp. TYF005]